jgi:caffeoyl-CoA O-methyltransferase
MEMVLPLADAYCEKFTSNSNDLLQEVEEFTQQNHAKAHMLSGKVQGRLLSFISKMIKPAKVLEIGTFTGYSALCLAEGLQQGGCLHSIELREQDASIAKQFFDKSAYASNLKLHIGDALQIISTLEEEWDIVFIDADKVAYAQYFDLVLPKLKQNGLIIVDNVLFHGQVLEENISGKNAIAIHEFNKKILRDDRVELVTLTVRDGLMLIRKNR